MRGEFLDLAGARLYYYAAGTRGAGEPVVFLHGFPTSSHLWSDVIPLMPPGHRLVVVDLLGYGRSDRPLDRPVDVRAHAERVVELLDQLRIAHACIVGHGIGGGIAQSLAIRHADARVSTLSRRQRRVRSLAHDRSAASRAPRSRSPAFSRRSLLVWILRRDLSRGYSDAERAAHSMDLYLRPFLSADGRDALVAHIRALTTDETRELGEQLERIAAPTAIVWGQGDRVIPLWVGKRLQQRIPAATLEVVPGARHFTPEEAPRQVADAIATLAGRASA